MDASQKILSDLTVYMKYAKFIPELERRETWEELVTRNMNMHIKKYPQIAGEIVDVYQYVYDKKVLPSMRSMQFIYCAETQLELHCKYLLKTKIWPGELQLDSRSNKKDY